MLALPVTLNSAELTAWLGQWLWPMFRIAAAVWIMPLFGGQSISPKARWALVVTLTFLVAPTVGSIPKVEALSPAAIVITFQQIGIGLAFGFLLRLWLALFAMVGQIISMQMGLAMAVMNDPSNGPGVAVLGSWFSTIASLAFLAMDGHLVAFTVLLESFQTMPIGTGFADVIWHDLANMGSWLFAGSLLVALPSVISMLIVNMAFGVMNRAAPQLNIIALGFPMTMLFGMVTVLFTMTALPGMLVTLTTEVLQLMQTLAGG
ncbi:flagellar biosynthetic protein FliR [Parendozoicomonas haliclonae]|uniref:Flagellar biosynthetic protein FliR n=1 Tax=Parendozoicomonas haliclonae TaxID=1960125 RepID=A0A1X7ANE7_9GAMM|nr:flagellar biosynthetic protein FliR [Parendozoicomonas haliclonae]SMA49617.1 Flagellar biosynthetic protein FliR [Parendozoicomonas haliclonae]